MIILDTVGSFLGEILAPHYVAWAAGALLLDAMIGDPVFSWHPIRLLGRWLAASEGCLFRWGANGYVGGVLLFLWLAVTVGGGVVALLALAAAISPWALHGVAVLVLWACLALRDLVVHGERVRRAIKANDAPAARTAIGYLVGRDTAPMDPQACGRAAVESLAENSVDGVLSPLLYACLFGPLGAVLFKIVSTMDSMVGYKTERYLRFGWCGARFDDVLNFPVARLSYVGYVALSWLLPGYHGRKAARVGWRDHALLPGPNSGWPEATVAGALERRLIGPIFKNGVQVCDLWVGEPSDPPAADSRDLLRTYVLVVGLTLTTLALAAVASFRLYSTT